MPSLESSSISALLRQLKSDQKKLSRIDVQDILDQLQIKIERDSLQSKDEFTKLLEFVLYGNLTLPQKNFIVKNLLIPSKESVPLPTSIILKILGNVGKPMKRGDSNQHKGIPTTLQNNLLKWLCCSIHLFGDEEEASSSTAHAGNLFLVKLLPILFNTLVYEFSRMYIANLIFLGLSSIRSSIGRSTHGTSASHLANPLRSWQIQLVMDLHFRFPTDDVLKNLLVFFTWIDPTLNYRTLLRHGRGQEARKMSLNIAYINPNVFVYPDNDYLARIIDIETGREMLEANLKQYERFYTSTTSSISRKRRRGAMEGGGAVEDIDLDLEGINYSKNKLEIESIHEVDSLARLIRNFSKIQFVNTNSVFRDDGTNFSTHIDPNYRYKLLYLVLQDQAASSGSPLTLRIEYYIRLTLLDSSTLLIPFLKKVLLYLSFGNQFVPSLKEFLYFQIAVSNSQVEATTIFPYKLQLLQYLPFTKSNLEEFEANFFANTEELVSSNSRLIVSFVEQLSLLYSRWYKDAAASSSKESELFYGILNRTVPRVYLMYTRLLDSTIPLVTLLSLFSLLRFLKQIEVQHLNEHIEPSAIVPPPALVYSMVLSGNPLITSEICGYVSFCKKYKFEGPSNQSYKNLQNFYLMDTLNFIWRDHSLKGEEVVTSYNKAMLLHPNFVHQLSVLNIMDYSSLISFNTIGNLFHNPSWSYITTEILRELEDLSPGNVNIRHPGPPTEESVSQIFTQEGAEWLNVTYDELKVLVLRRLDKAGFDGIADLLFTSLKTLANQRE